MLRIPFVEDEAKENIDMMETKKSFLKNSKTIEVAPSSYYKVSLTAEKAKSRQSSIGQRSHFARNTSESPYFSPLKPAKKEQIGRGLRCPLPLPQVKKLYDLEQPKMTFSASVAV